MGSSFASDLKRGRLPELEAMIRRGRDALKSAIAELQNEQIREAIAACGGNKRKAAASLGISRSFLYKKLAEIGETSNS